MKTTYNRLIEKIQQSNLAQADQELLIEILKNSKGNYTKFLSVFLGMIGLGQKAVSVLKLFDIDIDELIDKLL